MTMYHHRAAADIANFILDKWKNNEWLNDFISSDIELVGNPNSLSKTSHHTSLIFIIRFKFNFFFLKTS